MNESTNTLNTVAQGGVAATAMAFLHDALMNMIPFTVPALFLILLDLVYGVRAAKARGERVRTSTAIRRSFGKLFSYVCWLILASTLALSFEQSWIEWFVLGVVYANEFLSICGNYLETKGLELNMKSLYRWLLKKGAEKVGSTMEDSEANEIIRKKEEEEDGE